MLVDFNKGFFKKRRTSYDLASLIVFCCEENRLLFENIRDEPCFLFTAQESFDDFSNCQYSVNDFDLDSETIPSNGDITIPQSQLKHWHFSECTILITPPIEKKRKLPVYDYNKLQDFLQRFPTYKDFDVSDWLVLQLLGSINSVNVDILDLIRKEIDYTKWSISKVCDDLERGFCFGSEFLSQKISQFKKINKTQSLDTIATVIIDSIFLKEYQ